MLYRRQRVVQKTACCTEDSVLYSRTLLLRSPSGLGQNDLNCEVTILAELNVLFFTVVVIIWDCLRVTTEVTTELTTEVTITRGSTVVDGEVSNWKSVLSVVPQGSVLGPLLCLIYINDLDDNITSNVLKFADDTKVFRKVNKDGDKQHLQSDLDKLAKWSQKWQILFNFGKCKCLHTGYGNLYVK